MLSEAEMDVIRATLKELKGAARVWDVLSQERLTNRGSEELRQLYYQQGYGAAASGSWRKVGEKSTMGELTPLVPLRPNPVTKALSLRSGIVSSVKSSDKLLTEPVVHDLALVSFLIAIDLCLFGVLCKVAEG